MGGWRAAQPPRSVPMSRRARRVLRCARRARGHVGPVSPAHGGNRMLRRAEDRRRSGRRCGCPGWRIYCGGEPRCDVSTRHRPHHQGDPRRVEDARVADVVCEGDQPCCRDAASSLGCTVGRRSTGYLSLSSPASSLVQYEMTLGVSLMSTIALLSGPSSNHCSSSFIHNSCFFSTS